MTVVDVGAVDDFPDRRVTIVSANGRSIGVVAWRGEWFALRNICPHLGAPLCTGELWPLLTQESVTSEDLTVDLDRPVLMCPWHHWEFDLRDGGAITGKERARTYPVHIEDGRVKVDTSNRPARARASQAP